MAMNHSIIMGRLTAVPELRRTNSGKAVVSFTVACDKPGKDSGASFIDCVAWRGLGEMVAKYFTKGRMAVAAGKLDIREWTDKDGNKRRNAEVIADNVYFADSKNTTESDGNRPTAASNFVPMDYDDDEGLPF